MTEPSGRVIVLNGVSSAGKSSIAAAMRSLAGPETIVTALDDCLAALPRTSFNTPEGLTFVSSHEGVTPRVDCVLGSLALAAVARMRADVADAAAAGRQVIVDDVMLEPGDEAAYRGFHSAEVLHLVAVRVPLAVAEARERARGDRALGLARGQFERVHLGRCYDYELNATVAGPVQHAAAILAACGWLAS